MSSLSIAWRVFLLMSVLLLLAIGYGAYQTIESKSFENKYFQTRNYYEAAQDSLHRTRDVQGRETVIYKPAAISPKLMSELKYGLAAELRDQIRSEFGRNARLFYGQRAATTTSQVLPTVALKDTTVRHRTPAGVVTRTAKAGTFKDPWLSLTGIVTDDSLSVKYSIRNEFVVRAYSKKDKKFFLHFWAKRKVYVDLTNTNPNTTTDKMEAVLVEKE